MLILPAGVSLLVGLDAGLVLAGLPAPVRHARLPAVHGVVMVLGFLGTLISLERAVALRRGWGYAAPALLGLGGLALVMPLPMTVGQLLLVEGCVALVAVYAALWQRQRDDVTACHLLAAVMACCAALLWLRVDVALLLGWLVGFVVITIAAERVELGRLAMPAHSGRIMAGAAAAVLTGAVGTLLWPAVGARFLGLTLLLLVGWLTRHDVARRTIRGTGLPRLSAAAVLLGYLWLAVAAGTWLAGGVPQSTRSYDTVVHAVFLGFAMSMVIAHAPIVLPAVLRRPLPYHPALWVPLVALHLALVLRIGVGSGLDVVEAWRAGSLGTAVAVLLLLVVTLPTAAATRRRRVTSTPNRRVAAAARGPR